MAEGGLGGKEAADDGVEKDEPDGEEVKKLQDSLILHKQLRLFLTAREE